MDGKQPSFVRMFVRIGALKRFHFLKKKTAELPVSVEWDRRRSDRRPAGADDSADPRTVERRSNPPFTWETADFVVVEEPAATPPPDRESN